jgi:Outer membrane protein beta-barrel domain
MKLPRIISLVAPLVAILALGPVSAHAFGMSGVGGKLGLLTPENGNGTMAISGHLEFEEPGTAWHVLPSVMYWNEGGVSSLSANGDVYYHFRPEGMTTPYLGAGLGINRFDFEGTSGSNTELGLNLFGGVRFPMGTNHLFVEGRYTASDISQTSVLGGVTFHTPR